MAKGKKAVNDWLEKHKDLAELTTWGAVAAEAGVPPSTISAVRDKGKMSVKVARQLAEALCPPGRNLREFTGELFEIAGIDRERLGIESVADRVRRTRTIRAAYVVSEPFVMTPSSGQLEPSGFAVELFADVAALLGARVIYSPRPLQLDEVSAALSSDEVDVVVSAILKTFARERTMAFSAPMPFLRVPLSAIARSNLKLDLNARQLVDWVAFSRTDAALRALRLLLVDGEVGDEFVTTFLTRDGHQPTVRRVKTLEPEVLLEELKRNADVLIADMATCEAVMRLDSSAVRPVGHGSGDRIVDEALRRFDRSDLSALALYLIAFALPRGQQEWQDIVNGAMRSLWLEGVLPLVYVYQRYLDEPHNLRRFVHSRDEEVSSPLVRAAFAHLFKESEPYRSAGLPHGVFSTTGNLHIHIDGGGDSTVVESLLKRLESIGAKGKINKILDNDSGPQRQQLPQVYASHTPGSHGVEQFEYFATVGARTRDEAIRLLRVLLPEVARHAGLVVEVERVIGRVDADGRFRLAELAPLERIAANEVDMEPSPTLTFEIHHAFDLPGDVTAPPLAKVGRETQSRGLNVGGWFRFSKRGFIAYRSNAFSDGKGLSELVEREHAALQKYLLDSGFAIKPRTVVEEVLGIWHAPEVIAVA